METSKRVGPLGTPTEDKPVKVALPSNPFMTRAQAKAKLDKMCDEDGTARYTAISILAAQCNMSNKDFGKWLNPGKNG